MGCAGKEGGKGGVLWSDVHKSNEFEHSVQMQYVGKPGCLSAGSVRHETGLASKVVILKYTSESLRLVHKMKADEWMCCESGIQTEMSI